MNWAPPLLAVVSLTCSSVAASTSPPSCIAGAFHAGGTGSVTCHFGTDVNSTKRDFNVAHYATFSFIDTGTTILACNWKEDDLACTPKEGYTFDRTPLVDQITLTIGEVSHSMAGAYVCSLVGETTGALPAVPCNLTVTDENPLPVPQLPTDNNAELTSALTNMTDSSENPLLHIDSAPDQQSSQKAEGSQAVLIAMLLIVIIVVLVMAAVCVFLKLKYRLVRRQDNDIRNQNNERDDWDSLVFCKPVAWITSVYRTVVNRFRDGDEENVSLDYDAVQPLTSSDMERQNHIQQNPDDQTQPQSRNGSTRKSDLNRSQRHSQKNSPTAVLSASRPSSKSQGSLTAGSEMDLFPITKSTSRTGSQQLPLSPNKPTSKSEASLSVEYLPVSVRKGSSKTGSQVLNNTSNSVRDTVDNSAAGTPVKDILSSASGLGSSSSVSDNEGDTDAKDRDSNSVSSSSLPPEGCSICEAGSISRPKRLSCGHIFCERCIQKCLEEEEFCPECKLLLDPEYGNQPSDGTMSMFYSDKQSLPGYQGTGSYIIKYNFPPGIQGDDHPNPGKQYQGLRRSAYLPDTLEGRQVLMLLKTAFDRRLVFAVGHLSSGVVGVVWTNISHKTSMTGGIERNGYPDEYYLEEVQKELAEKSVTAKDLTSTMKCFIHNPRNFIRNTRDDFSGLFKTVHSTQC